MGLAEATDHEIIEVARRDRRIVVTADLDYPRLVLATDARDPGIILFRGGSYSDDQMLMLLDRVLAQADRLDLERSVIVAFHTRARLPILAGRADRDRDDVGVCQARSDGVLRSPGREDRNRSSRRGL